MRSPPLLLFILSINAASFAPAETVVDVSREWNAHASTSPVPVMPSTVTTVSPSISEASPACSCESLTTSEKLEQSTYAFTGRVIEAPAAKKGKRTIVFDVDEIFKGTPKQEMDVVEQLLGNECDLSFEEGQTYLVYAQWEWGSVITSRCMGTKLIEKAKGDARALGPSEAAKEKLYIHLRNACMGLGDTPCCLSSLKAMRAGYFVPEPEEGCPSGTIPDRLRCGGSYTWCIPVSAKDHRSP